jgi:hypothetical protein
VRNNAQLMRFHGRVAFRQHIWPNQFGSNSLWQLPNPVLLGRQHLTLDEVLLDEIQPPLQQKGPSMTSSARSSISRILGFILEGPLRVLPRRYWLQAAEGQLLL